MFNPKANLVAIHGDYLDDDVITNNHFLAFHSRYFDHRCCLQKGLGHGDKSYTLPAKLLRGRWLHQVLSAIPKGYLKG
jgi:hypothetical protein